MASTHITYRLDQVLDAYCEKDLKKVKDIIEESPIDISTISAELFLKNETFFNRWITIKKAIAENDYETVRKKLIDHALWHLMFAINRKSDIRVTSLVTKFEQLGTLTDKQKKRLTELYNSAVKIQHKEESSTFWPSYCIGGLSALTLGLAITEVIHPGSFNTKISRSEIAKMFFGGAATGAISYVTYWATKSFRESSKKITELLHGILKST